MVSPSRGGMSRARARVRHQPPRGGRARRAALPLRARRQAARLGRARVRRPQLQRLRAPLPDRAQPRGGGGAEAGEEGWVTRYLYLE